MAKKSELEAACSPDISKAEMRENLRELFRKFDSLREIVAFSAAQQGASIRVSGKTPHSGRATLEFEDASSVLAALVASMSDEEISAGLDTVPSERLVSVFELVKEEAPKRYHREIFGAGRASLTGFRRWLRAEAKRQAIEPASAERKRFVANAIQHFLKTKNWVLYAADAKTGEMTACNITTGAAGKNRRFLFKVYGETTLTVASGVDFPDDLEVSGMSAVLS